MRKIILIFAYLSFSNLTSQVPNYVPTNGLMGWWPLNGNASDSSENTNHGILEGATPIKNRFGQNNMALSFDGLNDQVVFNVKQLTNFSISIWHKPIDSGDNYDPIFQLKKDCISSGYDRNGSAFMYTLKEDNKVKIAFKYMPRDCNTASTSFGGRISEANTTFDNWSHYIMTWNDTIKELLIYHNGKKIFSNTTQITFNTIGNELLRLGKLHEGTNSIIWSSCNADDLGFWNRPLDSNEIKMLFLSKKCDTKFISEPEDTSVANNEIEFSCQFSDSNAKYSWETNQGLGWIVLSNAGQYSGVKTNILKVNNLNLSNDNQLFRCIASGDCGLDTSVVARLNYRLNHVDFQSENPLIIFPNPTIGPLQIHGLAIPFKYTVQSTHGKIIQKGTAQDSLDITTLENGSYIIRINNKSFYVIKN
jgi:hypothetical protein